MRVSESAMAGAAILIILHEILSIPVAFWTDSPHNKLKISLTVLGWNAANSDLVSLTYVSKLQLDISISFAKSGPII